MALRTTNLQVTFYVMMHSEWHTCTLTHARFIVVIYVTYIYRLYANKTEDLINERKFASWNLCNSN